MIKEMNGNLLRLHVHAEKDTTDGINDPRYAEYADQLGVYLLWQTAAWIREGEAWNVDFEGYPKLCARSTTIRLSLCGRQAIIRTVLSCTTYLIHMIL